MLLHAVTLYSYEVLDELLLIILGEKKGKIPSVHEEAAKKIRETIKATEHKRKNAPIMEL